MGLFDKIFGTNSERAIKQIMPIVKQINALEPSMEAKSDLELKEMTTIFKKRLASGETLDDILPEAFAVVREAGKRVLGQRHYDVQLIGGIVLHEGRVAEMKTGEGKTLVSTLPAYLNALEGKGAHIVTVNDYLAKRDSEWMGKIYNFLGLSVGCIVHGLNNDQRREAYAADITYGTNNEIGFDYLRDNMVIYKANLVQRGLNFAIVDEVDSILIDEARTPLIIAGQGDKPSDIYYRANDFVKGLKKLVLPEDPGKDKSILDDAEEDYIVLEKEKTANLTRNGVHKAEQYFAVTNLGDPENAELNHHIRKALHAHGCMKRDVDYVIEDGEVVIVDEFTGRKMPGRRYSEGLHQAIEAKEHVIVQKENMTMATITFQNLFRTYNKLSGMTGTALTEEEEFNGIYGLDVVAIPTNKPVQRIDYPDAVYRTVRAKYQALLNDTIAAHEKGQPVLIGTVSVEKSEFLSNILSKNGIKHNVLNAKNHEREAEIVAQAGKFGSVTVATNMAGRGTDIVLGGNAEYMAKQDMRKEGYTEELIAQADSHADTDNLDILNARKHFNDLVIEHKKDTSIDRDKVLEAGGLFIMGTERHESRRIDNQLRGRAGRQGDPGMSRFYISLEDDLMRLFGSERMESIVATLGLDESTAIEHPILSKAIESAQKKVEARNFDSRKYVLKYDDVINRQREIIYAERRRVLDGENISEQIAKMISSRIDDVVMSACNQDVAPAEWQFDTVKSELSGIILPEQVDEVRASIEGGKKIKPEKFAEILTESTMDRYAKRETELGSDTMREVERVVLLRKVDENWIQHIDSLESLKREIQIQAYGHKDPVVEFEIESFNMFEEMNATIREDTVRTIFTVKVVKDQQLERKAVATANSEGFESAEQDKPAKKNMKAGNTGGRGVTMIRTDAKVGRNDPCPCGSGEKYKNCCGS